MVHSLKFELWIKTNHGFSKRVFHSSFSDISIFKLYYMNILFYKKPCRVSHNPDKEKDEEDF